LLLQGTSLQMYVNESDCLHLILESDLWERNPFSCIFFVWFLLAFVPGCPLNVPNKKINTNACGGSGAAGSSCLKLRLKCRFSHHKQIFLFHYLYCLWGFSFAVHVSQNMIRVGFTSIYSETRLLFVFSSVGSPLQTALMERNMVYLFFLFIYFYHC